MVWVSNTIVGVRFGGYLLRMVSLLFPLVLQDLKGDVLFACFSVRWKRSVFDEQKLGGMDYFGGLPRALKVAIGV